MIKKMIYAIVLLSLLTNCAKDKGTPIYDDPKDIQKILSTYIWQPIPVNEGSENQLVNYKPDDCEMDNSYRFLFEEKSNQMKLDRGRKICEANAGILEQLVFKGKNTNAFTFNEEKSTIKFSDSDEYSSYLLAIEGTRLIITYQNNNPAAFVVPVKYYFKGVKE
ncbi:hypothetical protein [Sphingobacterium faecium]